VFPHLAAKIRGSVMAKFVGLHKGDLFFLAKQSFESDSHVEWIKDFSFDVRVKSSRTARKERRSVIVIIADHREKDLSCHKIFHSQL
jgi:hypothetical protein